MSKTPMLISLPSAQVNRKININVSGANGNNKYIVVKFVY